MAAEEQSGQSMIEFLLILPLMIGLTLILLRVNSVIQMGIVNQQYARAQALFLAQNSSIYPRRNPNSTRSPAEVMIRSGNNQLVMGVAEELLLEVPLLVPSAPTFMITRNKTQAGPDEQTPEEPVSRSRVRVRTSVSLCAPSLVVRTGALGTAPATSAALKQPFNSRDFNYCYFNLQGKSGRTLQ